MCGFIYGDSFLVCQHTDCVLLHLHYHESSAVIQKLWEQKQTGREENQAASLLDPSCFLGVLCATPLNSLSYDTKWILWHWCLHSNMVKDSQWINHLVVYYQCLPRPSSLHLSVQGVQRKTSGDEEKYLCWCSFQWQKCDVTVNKVGQRLFFCICEPLKTEI